MRILSVNIGEFGGLKNFSLEFSEGLNLIVGENESGKSTILLFIMYMFYGLPKSSRKGTPSAYDKARSLSLDGMRAAGSMEIENDGRTYRIERANARRTVSSEAVVTDLGTGARLSIGEEVGEYFLGISRESFESCLWCGQTRASAINGDKVAQTLSNLSLTADESVNVDEVLGRIKEARKYYKHERGEGGLISEVSGEISSSLLRLQREEGIHSELLSCREECDRLTERKAVAEEALRVAEEKRAAVRSLEILSRFETLRGQRLQIEKDSAELERLSAESGFGDRSASVEDIAELRALGRRYEELKKKANAEELEGGKADHSLADIAEKISARESENEFLNRIENSKERVKRKKIFAVAGFAIFAVFAAAGFFAYPLWAIAAVSLIFGAAMIVFSKKDESAISDELNSLGCDTVNYEEHIRHCFERRSELLAAERALEEARIKRELANKELLDTERDIESVLLSYGRERRQSLIEDLNQLVLDMSDYLSRVKRIEDKLSLEREMSARNAKKLEEYDEAKLVSSLPEGITRDTHIDEAAADSACAEARAESERINTRINDLKIKLASAGVDDDSLSDIRKNIAMLEERKREYTERYDILNRAFSAVETAYSNMRRNFAPRIRERAGELLCAVSDGRYSKLFLSEELDVSVEAAGREMSAGYLSTGTADAVYIALRFALIENIFEGCVPFFMDESLSALDDKRAASALALISKFTEKGNQCLLFTCHTREGSICDTLGIEKNEIFLGGK